MIEQGPGRHDQDRPDRTALDEARQVQAEMAKHGGIITEADLKNYKAVERPVLRGSYRGLRIVSMPPPAASTTTSEVTLTM